MSGPHDRRGFLRGLASLPLIGGGVALIGQPSAVGEPITPDLLWSYKSWLHFEHRMLSYELAGHDLQRAREHERFQFEDCPGDQWHFQWDGRGPAGWIDAPQPSGRAALVLSAVGCDWKTA